MSTLLQYSLFGADPEMSREAPALAMPEPAGRSPYHRAWRRQIVAKYGADLPDEWCLELRGRWREPYVCNGAQRGGLWRYHVRVWHPGRQITRSESFDYAPEVGGRITRLLDRIGKWLGRWERQDRPGEDFNGCDRSRVLALVELHRVWMMETEPEEWQSHVCDDGKGGWRTRRRSDVLGIHPAPTDDVQAARGEAGA